MEENKEAQQPEANDSPDPVVEEANSEQEEAKEEASQEKDEKVEINDPKVKERFDKLWKELKTYKKQSYTALDHSRQMAVTLSKMAEKLDKYENNTVSNEYRSQVDDIKSQIKKARDIGDEDLQDRLNERLIDLKAEAKITERERKYRVEQQKYVQQQQQSVFTPEEENWYSRVSNKTDEDGEYTRPWLHEGHPDYKFALQEADRIKEENPEYRLYDIVYELDRKMEKKRPSTPPVMGKVLTPKPSKSKLELSEQQKNVAHKMGISEEEYAKHVSLMKRV